MLPPSTLLLLLPLLGPAHARLDRRQSASAASSPAAATAVPGAASGSASAAAAATATGTASAAASAAGTGSAARTSSAVPVAANTVPAAPQSVSAVSTFLSIPLEQITSSATSHATMTVSTYAAGATNTLIDGHPVLPAINAPLLSRYPTPDVIAPGDSPEVAEWMAQIDWSKVPNITATVGTGACADNVDAAKDTSRCWWTCGSCVRDSDIVNCPKQDDWGLNFDDGPAPYTPTILNWLETQDLSATFFVIGSRALYRPELVQYEFMKGHHIGVHTFSHHPMTTLSNAQVVAELGWTKKLLTELLGVTPLHWRPPFGDVDDRVRAIATQMNLTTIIWTAAPVSGQANFDTNDWKISSGTGNSSGTNSYNVFQKIVETAKTLDHGIITLEHDLYQQSVDLAYNYIVPYGIQQGLKPQSIQQCIGKSLSDVYTPVNAQSGTKGTAAGSSKDAVPTSSAALSSFSSASMRMATIGGLLLTAAAWF